MPSAKVFISYQWDHQEEAIRVRQFLEEVTTILDIWDSKKFFKQAGCVQNILQPGRTILLDGHRPNGRGRRSLHSDLPGFDHYRHQCKSGKPLVIKDQGMCSLCLTLCSLRVFPLAAFSFVVSLQSRLSPTTAPRLGDQSWNITLNYFIRRSC